MTNTTKTTITVTARDDYHGGTGTKQVLGQLRTLSNAAPAEHDVLEALLVEPKTKNAAGWGAPRCPNIIAAAMEAGVDAATLIHDILDAPDAFIEHYEMAFGQRRSIQVTIAG